MMMMVMKSILQYGQPAQGANLGTTLLELKTPVWHESSPTWRTCARVGQGNWDQRERKKETKKKPKAAVTAAKVCEP